MGSEQTKPSTILAETSVKKTEGARQTSNPFFLRETLSSDLHMRGGDDAIFAGMLVPTPGHRPEFTRIFETTVISELRNPVNQLLDLIYTVTEQSYAIGEEMYRPNRRERVITEILKNVSNNERYQEIIDLVTKKSSHAANEAVKFSIFLLSNTNFLKAITGYVLDSLDTSRYHLRIEEFEKNLRNAHWHDEMQQGVHLEQQTARGSFTVQTTIDPKISERLLALFVSYRDVTTRQSLAMLEYTEQEPSTVRDRETEVLARQEEREKKEKQLLTQLINLVKKENPPLLPTATPIMKEDMELRQHQEDLEQRVKKERLIVEYRSIFAASVVESKIQMMKDAVAFLSTDYGKAASEVPLLSKISGRMVSALKAQRYNVEAKQTFRRLQEVYRMDPESNAVLDLLHEQFGLDREKLSQLQPKEVELLIRRAKSIVLHGFGRNEKHEFEEITFASEPRHFVVLVHGSPYSIEYYNPEDGFATNKQLVRALQALEFKHLAQEVETTALESRRVVAAVWTELSYNTKKNTILSDEKKLARFISRRIKADLPNREETIEQIVASISTLLRADFSVSTGAREVPAFGRDDHSGEVFNLVPGGQHIDISDNLRDVLQKKSIDDLSLFTKPKQGKSEVPLSVRLNSRFDHEIIDGREADQTNSALASSAVAHMLKAEHIAAMHDTVSPLQVEALNFGFDSDTQALFDSEKVIAENMHEYVETFPAIPESLGRSPSALSEEFRRSLYDSLREEFEEKIKALPSLNTKQLLEQAIELHGLFTESAIEARTAKLFPESWKNFVESHPLIRDKSPRETQKIKDQLYKKTKENVAKQLRDFLRESNLLKKMQDFFSLTPYDFSAVLSHYKKIDKTKIEATSISEHVELLPTLLQKEGSFSVLQQLQDLHELRGLLSERVALLRKDKKAAMSFYSSATKMSAVFEDELLERIRNPEEEYIASLLVDIKKALKQLNVVLINLSYNPSLQEQIGTQPILDAYRSMQLDRISWVTAVHYADSVANIMSLVDDTTRPALQILPTSRNVVALHPINRLDFHTMAGHASVKEVLGGFGVAWNTREKANPEVKAAVVTSFKKLLQNYVSYFSMPFQVGLDQARRQASNLSVINAGSNKTTRWMLEMALIAIGNQEVYDQYRTTGLVSAVHSTPGTQKNTGLLAELSTGEMTPEDHMKVVLTEAHGIDSLHTALPFGVKHAHGVTFRHGEEAGITIKERLEISDEHLDQVAQEMLGLERKPTQKIVEKVKPRYYFSKLSVEQQREALTIAKKELAAWTHSFYRWYVFINVMTKQNISAVESAYDAWSATETSQSFLSYYMQNSLSEYGLNQEALDYYKNGSGLHR